MGLLKPWDSGGFDGSCLPGMTTSVSSLEPARDEAERQLVLKQPFCVVVFQGWFGWSMARGYDGLHEECSAMPEMRKIRWCSWCILEGASRDFGGAREVRAVLPAFAQRSNGMSD